MEFTTLGRTGLTVSRLGLGCGGHSRLGTRRGNTDTQAEDVVRVAVELGINFIDTAESYGTEAIVGRTMSGVPRDSVVLSTKAGVDWEDTRCSPVKYRERVEACLSRLQTDYIDIFHVHGVTTDEYEHAVNICVPVLQRLKEEGKVRFIGITEAFGSDPAHQMLSAAEHDDCWDVMMVGFNLLNQTARDRVFPWTQRKGIGVLEMFAVRRALTDPVLARKVILDLVEEGIVDSDGFDLDDPLGFLVADGVASSLSEAAYRYCRHEPGIDVVLSGTGSIEHLRQNAESLAMPPLPDEVLAKLKRLFAEVDSVAGN